jgi:hypothetical protein
MKHPSPLNDQMILDAPEPEDHQPPDGDCRASACSLSEDPDWGELKLALNEAIWTKAPGTTTLEQAEHAACLAIGYLNKCFEANA